MSNHHHGKIIKEYREKRGMTQAELAEKWPRAKGDVGASVNKESYGDGTDFVFQKMSGILLLRSRGYLRIHEPKKTLALHDELKRQVDADANLWLDFRLHLYRARAYLMLNEVEGCIEAGREFFHDVVDWQSPHRTARGYELLAELEDAGYKGVKVVREFRDDLAQAMQSSKK